MYLNYSISKLFSLLIDTICNYKIFVALILSAIIYSVLYLINIKVKKFDFITIVINFLIIILIIYYYNTNLFNIGMLKYFYHNMYFYFLSSIIYLILVSIMLYKNKLKKVSIINYGLAIIFLLYALFMTYYLSNVDIVVLGNIYPSIVLGNFLYFTYYLIVLIWLIKNIIFKLLNKKH